MGEAKKKKPGRNPLEPTPAITKVIEKVILNFGTDKGAYTLANISSATYYKWLELGRQQSAGPYAEFLKTIEGAKEKRELEMLSRIKTAAREPKNWQAAKELLKITNPKRYNDKVYVYVEEELTDGVERVEAAFPDPDEKLTGAEALERAYVALAGKAGATEAESTPSSEDGEDDSGSQAVPAAPPKPEAITLPESDV